MNWDQFGASLVSASPEFSAAQARVNRARANLERQQVQAIPNVTTQLAAGVDNGTNSSIINLQVGAPIPVFNKNQGNIAAARAEFTRATLEMQRIENAIKSRLAVVSRDFETASAAVAKYSQEILPSAAEGLKLAELAYQSGETSFIQVLVARRTYFDTNLQYVASQTQLAQAQAKLDGFVLTGALDPVVDQSGDDSLRGQTFSQQ
jgi:cobalt-zinc-cadmium efflux system outer membrane protein